MPGVVTLTPAGAIDATYAVRSFTRGGFVRASSYSREVSGKGVNVSAALALAGVSTSAVVVLGADDLAFAAASEHEYLLRVVDVPGATRVNTAIVDDAGTTTKVNAPTPPLSEQNWGAAVDAAFAEVDRLDARWFTLCGALPLLRGTDRPVSIDRLCEDASERGVRVAIDTSGVGLTSALEHAADISLIKPNASELFELTGLALRTVGDVVDAARTVIDRGVEIVIVSMGADGGLVVTADVVAHAHAVPMRLGNSAGAGDAFLAGFLAALGDRPPASAPLVEAIGTAASWGAHAVAQTTTLLPSLVAAPEAHVDLDVSPRRALREPAG